MVAAQAGADHDRMLRTTTLIALAGLACAFAAGCGDDATRDPAAAKAQPAKVDVERFLMQAGEEPGFDPVEAPRTDHGVQSLAGGFAADEVERLRRAGFISITFQPLSGDDHNAGVTTVLLFKTAEGARDWLEYETSDEGIDSMVPGAKPKRFTVRGVPGARGWTGRDRHGNPIGHVFWVQGRCEMVLGNEGEGDFVEPLSIGANGDLRAHEGPVPVTAPAACAVTCLRSSSSGTGTVKRMPPRSNSMSLWRSSMSAKLRRRTAISSRPRRSLCSTSKMSISSPSSWVGWVPPGSRPAARRRDAGV